MATHPTTLEQFRSFCFQNKATDFEQAVEYFAVFGGMGWKVDMSKSLDELIEEKVLKNYRYIHGDIAKITQSDRIHHALLSGLATGDSREHSAFKRANVSREDGEKSIDFLVQNDLLIREKSQAQPVNEREEVSDKLRFTLPFLRFWFSSISPYYKGIRDGDYSEVHKRLENMKEEFSQPIYNQLVQEAVSASFQDDKIDKMGSYWDKSNEIALLGKTKSGKIVAGINKYSKSKAKKSELTRLKEQCTKAELDADIFVVFSKNGFSNEMKKEKSAQVRLLALKHLKALVADLNENDLLVNTNKKY